MDIQQRLIDLANEKIRITSEDELLIDAMKVIDEFIKGIRDGVDTNQPYDSASFNTHTLENHSELTIGDESIGFIRRDRFIEVYGTNLTDKLVVENNTVISKNFNLPFNNQLMEKYTENFFTN